MTTLTLLAKNQHSPIRKRWAMVGLVALFAVFFALDLHHSLTLERLGNHHAQLILQIAAHPRLSAAIYWLLFVTVTSLSLPGSALMTLLGGALFGMEQGICLVATAAPVGATGAFLASRYLFRDAVDARYGKQLHTCNQGISKDGAWYLMSMRLLPMFPFFLINLVCGLTRLRVRTYAWVTAVGMLPGVVLYVTAGSQLAALTSISDAVSPEMLGGRIGLAALPLLVKAGLSFRASRARRASAADPGHRSAAS